MKPLPRLKNYKEYLQTDIDDHHHFLIKNSSLPKGTKKLLLNYTKGYVCSVACGRAKIKKGYYIVPLWAYTRGYGYFQYYVAHELSHIAARYRKGNGSNHGADFYKNFKDICPKKLQKYEFPYKPRMAELYGLSKK